MPVTTEGFNYLLNAGFRGSTQISTWYMGLISYSATAALSKADTMSSHTGWSEFTSYDESVRQTWTAIAAAGGAITNTTTVAFTTTGSGNQLYGFFIASNSTKSGTTGTLWVTGAFSTTRFPTAGQVLRFTYTITGASS